MGLGSGPGVDSFALAPLTYPGYFETWSGLGPAYALQDLAAGRSVAIWGIGWPTPFQGGPDGPFAWLLALGLFRLGGGAAVAVRWLLGISMASGALGSYAWLRQRWAPVQPSSGRWATPMPPTS